MSHRSLNSSSWLTGSVCALLVACSSDPAPGPSGAAGSSGASVSTGGNRNAGGSATSGGNAPGSGGSVFAGGTAGFASGATAGASSSVGGVPNGGGASGGTPSGGTPGAGGANGGANGGGTPGAGGANGGANGGAPSSSGGQAAGSTSVGAAGGVGGAGTGGQAGSGAGAPGGSAGAGPGSFGQDTPAGRGGAVIKVTNLNASGAGSLREALATPGPRVIVFEVGGVIDLNRTRLDVTEPFVTIAGQTAPTPGITLIRGGMRVMTHDVSIQHLRVRMGDAGDTAAAGFEPDVTTDGAAAYNIVFDHVSVSWGVDENLSVSGPRLNGPLATSRRVTIRNSIISEGLQNSVHSKGAHSMGTLIHDYCSEVAVVGNLYAHNNERNPWFKGFATGVIVNNVVYNPGVWAMRLGPVLTEWTGSGITPEGPRVSIVGNYMRHGQNTPAGSTMVGSNSLGSAFLEDNIAVTAAGASAPIASSTITLLPSRPIWPDGLVARPAASVVDWVLAHAGARPKERDAVDQRLVMEVLSSPPAGSHIDSQDAVGGYPAPAPTQRTLTVPADVEGWLRDLAVALE